MNHTMKRNLCLLILALFLSSQTFAQKKQTREQLEDKMYYYALKMDEHYDGSQDSVRKYIDSTALLATKNGMWDYVVSSHVYRYGLDYQYSRYRAAEDHLVKAKELFEKHRAYIQSVDPENFTERQFTYNLALHHSTMGNHFECIEVLEPFVKKERSLENQDFIFQALSLLSRNYSYTLQPEKALTAAELSNKYASKLDGNFGKDIPYIFLGKAHQANGDEDKAVMYFKMAYNQHKAAPEAANQFSIACMNLGQNYMYANKLDSAMAYFQEALVDVRKKQDLFNEFNVLKNIAELYLKKRNYGEARKNITAALDKAKTVYAGKHPYIANILLVWGRIEADQNNDAEAINLYQQALEQISTKYKGSKSAFNNPALDDIKYKRSALPILDAKAASLLKLYYKTKDAKYLKAAEETQELALQALKITHVEFDWESSKETLAGSNYNLIETYLGIMKAYAEKPGSKAADYIERAFRTAEYAKTGLLLEQINKAAAITYSGIPSELTRREHKLKQIISFCKQQISKAELSNSTNDLTAIREELIAATEEYNALVKTFERDFPLYYAFKYADNTIDIKMVQQKLLGKNELALEYVLGERELFVFVITKAGVQLKSKTLPSGFKATLAELRTNLTDFEAYIRGNNTVFNDFVRLSNLVYNTLLADVLDDKTYDALYVIPDGELSYIPFELLISTTKGKSNDFSSLAYLIRRFPISYSMSLSHLYQQEYGRKIKPGKKLAAYAPSYELEGIPEDFELDESAVATIRRYGLVPLPGALEEAQNIAKLCNGTAITGTAATEHRFKENVGQYNIIHLAMHAVLEDRNPMMSKLIFTPTPDSLEDQQLTIAELYQLPLNAELAVLSACNTGMGKLQRGQGIISLSHAFAYAGCRSTLMSLWEVPDQITSQLMENFYKYLREGKPKNEALRLAKLDILEGNKSFTHPFFWSTFVASGDMRPVYPRSNLWLFALIAVLGVGGIYWYSRK
jgi:CHAT domain-containing protein/tetratricopeptide (TPR) repeat protein